VGENEFTRPRFSPAFAGMHGPLSAGFAISGLKSPSQKVDPTR
jgi:hypothetical protein